MKTQPIIAGFKMDKGAISQGMASQKRQGNGFSPGAPRKERSPADTLILAQ